MKINILHEFTIIRKVPGHLKIKQTLNKFYKLAIVYNYTFTLFGI